MQYLSLDPIALALENKMATYGKGFPPLDGINAEEEHVWKRKQALVEKLKLHSVVKHPRTSKELALPIIVEQINCSHEINTLFQKNVGLVGTRVKRALSVSERVVQSAENLWDYIWACLLHVWNYYTYPVIVKMFVLGLMFHRIAGELFLQVLDYRLWPDAAALRDVSATAQQVDIRLQQFCYWPMQYSTLRKRKTDWQSITNSHPEYIRFFNSLWLVANDVIMGVALGSYIIENHQYIAAQVDVMITGYLVVGLQDIIIWLMQYPAGLKLNNELATFLGDLFLWVIEHWA
ncbi:hypothetical protein LTS18_013119, partial [Coniosporium uncinatum]